MTCNPNLSSPNKFSVVIPRFPTLNMFVQSVPIPGVSLGITQQFTGSFVDIPRPSDKMIFENVTMNFLLDEDIQGPIEILNWMRDTSKSVDDDQYYTDISIFLLSNNSNPNRTITFHDAWPTNMGGWQVDAMASEENPLVYSVTFAYSYYSITTT